MAAPPTRPDPCARALVALETCQRRHARDAALVCRAPAAVAAWCLIRHASPCGAEAADLEDCAAPARRGGGSAGGRAGSGAPPTHVPARCEAAAGRLEACLDRAAAAGERGGEGGEGEGKATPVAGHPGGAAVVVGRRARDEG